MYIQAHLAPNLAFHFLPPSLSVESLSQDTILLFFCFFLTHLNIVREKIFKEILSKKKHNEGAPIPFPSFSKGIKSLLCYVLTDNTLRHE